MAVHAVCCWCGTPLRHERIWRAEVWACPKDACFNRCWQYAISYRQRSDKAKSGLGVERLFWLPLPRQVEAIEAVYRGVPRVLFGGARGGSKSHFIRCLHYGQALKYDNFHGLILRRKFPELEQTHIMRVRREAHLLGGTYRETTRTIEWPNGSITRMGHCQTDDDAENYLSAEYDLISFDELVTFPFTMAMRIISSLRSAGRTGYTPQVVSGTNPGGPEAWWVRSMYIDREMDVEEYPDYDPSDYAFIPSKLEDNPYLDKQYEKTLLALPPMLRKAYRDGSWDVWPGQYFPEWNRNIHVADRPNWSPRGCRVYCGIDWGYVRPGCCLWVAIEPEGHAYVFDEYTFKATITPTVAKEIKRRSKEWGVKPIYVADTQMWGGQDQTGEDMRETFARCGVGLTQANKDRVNGWQRLRAWLAMAPDGVPWMRVHPRCVSLIRTLPSLQQDENKPEDVDCWVAGTMVSTPSGDVPIESIAPGVFVHTPIGPRRVLRSYLSGSSRTSWARLSNGALLSGTPHHKVYVTGKGLVALDSLVCYDIPTRRNIAWSRLLHTAGSSTAGIRDACTTTLAAAARAFTAVCGWMRDARFLPAGIFTTSTATTTTTPWGIWPVSRQTNTPANTSLRVWPVSLENGSRHGVALRLASEPCETTRGRCEPTHPSAHRRAELVARYLRRDTHGVTSVLRRAKRLLVTSLSGCAQSAAKRFGLNPTTFARLLPVHIVAVGRSDEAVPVYNLTVDDAHLFYANGVLSSNTDSDDHWAEALRYVVSARPAPGMQSASKRLVEGSVGWLLNREARKPKGLLARRA